MKPTFTGRAFSPFKLSRMANSVPLPNLVVRAVDDSEEDWSDSDDDMRSDTPRFGARL